MQEYSNFLLMNNKESKYKQYLSVFKYILFLLTKVIQK